MTDRADRTERDKALTLLDECGPEADKLLMALVHALLAIEDRIDWLVYLQTAGPHD